MPTRATSRRIARRARVSRPDKQTHKLTPQTCVVWVPDAPGYAAHFGPGVLKVASHPEFAAHLTESQAESLALALRSHLGLRTAIRPYYPRRQAGAGSGFEASPMVITGINSGARKSD